MFEYFGGDYYRLDTILGSGDSFGQQILRKQGKKSLKGYKTNNGSAELAILNKDKFT